MYPEHLMSLLVRDVVGEATELGVLGLSRPRRPVRRGRAWLRARRGRRETVTSAPGIAASASEVRLPPVGEPATQGCR